MLLQRVARGQLVCPCQTGCWEPLSLVWQVTQNSLKLAWLAVSQIPVQPLSILYSSPGRAVAWDQSFARTLLPCQQLSEACSLRRHRDPNKGSLLEKPQPAAPYRLILAIRNNSSVLLPPVQYSIYDSFQNYVTNIFSHNKHSVTVQMY